MAVFDLQNTKPRSFSRFLLEILYTSTPSTALSHIFRFFMNKKYRPPVSWGVRGPFKRAYERSSQFTR